MTAVRALTVTAGVLLSIVSVVLAAAAIGLFLDGSAGAGGFAVFVVMVTLLCALLLFQATPARRPVGPPRQRKAQRDTGFYYGDSTPAYGAAAGRSHDRWGGDGGADSGTSGHGSGHGHGGWGGSDAGADGSSSGSDGGGGSDGGAGSSND